MKSVGYISGNDRVGGLVGVLSGAALERILLSDACVTGGVEAQRDVGGCVGYAEGGARLSECAAGLTVKGENNVGGLVGCLLDSNMENCYATGFVQGRGTGPVGGLAGLGDSSAYQTIRRCYFAGHVEGGNGVTAGLVGYSTNSALHIAECRMLGVLSADVLPPRIFGGTAAAVGNLAMETLSAAGEASEESPDGADVTRADVAVQNEGVLPAAFDNWETAVWTARAPSDADLPVLAALPQTVQKPMLPE